jgi:hypothetical protein
MSLENAGEHNADALVLKPPHELIRVVIAGS